MTLANHRQRYKMFLERLRQARLEADLTQVEVAEVLGKPQSFESKCETGERRVDFVELLTFAEIYQKPLSFFEGNYPAGPPNPPILGGKPFYSPQYWGAGGAFRALLRPFSLPGWIVTFEVSEGTPEEE